MHCVISFPVSELTSKVHENNCIWQILAILGNLWVFVDGCRWLWPIHSLVQLNSFDVNPLSANITKWSNTLKQFVGKLPTNCLSVFGHFVGLAVKGLRALSDAYFRKLNFHHLFLHIKLPFNVEWLYKVMPATKSLHDLLLMPDIVGLWCFAKRQFMMLWESFYFLFCLKTKNFGRVNVCGYDDISLKFYKLIF